MGKTTLPDGQTEDEFVLLTILDGKIKAEFSKGLSKQRHVSFIMSNGFSWAYTRQEAGVLSRSRKEILYLEISLKSMEDRKKLEWLADYFSGRKIQVLYTYPDKKGEFFHDWEELVSGCLDHMGVCDSERYCLLVNRYGNVDATAGLPAGWHITTLTATQTKKLGIPLYKACTGFEYSNYSSVPAKPVLKNIIPDDFSGKEEEYLGLLKEKERRKDEKIQAKELTMDLIAECIYSVNKEAKRKRDIQEDCINRAYRDRSLSYAGVHYVMHKAKREKTELYGIKEEALMAAVRAWSIKPDGYHVFKDKDRDMYTIAGYTFHADRRESDLCLGEISDEISSERKRSIPPAKAVKILKRFIQEEQEKEKEKKKEKENEKE